MSAHQGQAVGQGNRQAELIALAAVGGGDFLLLAPGGARAGVEISGARIRTPRVLAVGANQRHARVDGAGVTEVVVCLPVAGGELACLTPGRAGAGEHVGRARVGPLGIVVIRGGQHVVAMHRHRAAEAVAGRHIKGQDLLLLGPGGAGAGVDIGRPGLGALVVVQVGAHHSGVAVDAHSGAEPVVGRAIGGSDLVLLQPPLARAGEDVGRARVAAPVVVQRGADDGGGAVQGYRLAEVVRGGAVLGGDLGGDAHQGRIHGDGVGGPGVVGDDADGIAAHLQPGGQGASVSVQHPEVPVHGPGLALQVVEGDTLATLHEPRLQGAEHGHLQHQLAATRLPPGDVKALLQAHGTVEVPLLEIRAAGQGDLVAGHGGLGRRHRAGGSSPPIPRQAQANLPGPLRIAHGHMAVVDASGQAVGGVLQRVPRAVSQDPVLRPGCLLAHPDDGPLQPLWQGLLVGSLCQLHGSGRDGLVLLSRRRLWGRLAAGQDQGGGQNEQGRSDPGGSVHGLNLSGEFFATGKDTPGAWLRQAPPLRTRIRPPLRPPRTGSIRR